MVVTQYEAESGQELQRADKPQYLTDALTAGSVAATTGGVWVSVRYGMAGPAFELSSSTLEMIAPPPPQQQCCGTYWQIMGVGSGVSDGTLWLSNAQGPDSLIYPDPYDRCRSSQRHSSDLRLRICNGAAVLWHLGPRGHRKKRGDYPRPRPASAEIAVLLDMVS